MGYWKSKVLPKIKKIFEKNGTKKTAAAAEACKSFDDSKEEINKDFEAKKDELQPKVIEIYEASSTEIKTLVKEPKEAGLKNSTAVQKFLDELVKIEFPGSKAVCEASSKYGPGLVSGPVLFLFEKVSTFIVTEENEEELPPPTTNTTGEEEASGKEKEIVIEEEKKEEVAVMVEEREATEAVAAAAEPAKP
ncbi:plasma membrane-associated cation-binding protein 1 [Vitis riparia]|uniref:plasma membrane-associated cation-binding protein 1 n=1 Tax=Vitis riparia TaxID=96939 RepID=UPI00155AAF0A|nr:plasma membrane-associated cation-binding protein 1 [Vitis riparia]XP_034674931.1 plasma membrane-associated cation-binding protein 1 [Vitis riparia]XP_034675002.1 plasma membrane-associated cation-binding protein 1 [Vitis riparia]